MHHPVQPPGKTGGMGSALALSAGEPSTFPQDGKKGFDVMHSTNHLDLIFIILDSHLLGVHCKSTPQPIMKF